MGETAIVIDIGGQNLKAGYSWGWPTPEEPRLVTPSVATEAGTNLPLRAMECGVVSDWRVLETVIHYALYTQLGWVEGGEGNVLLVEPALTSRRDRELFTQLMFEVFNVSSYVATDSAAASLTAMGKLSGTVVDIGYDKIDVVPVIDGTTQPSAATRIPVGGSHLTSHLQKLLKDLQGIRVSNEEAEKIKISCMHVAPVDGMTHLAAAPFPAANGAAITPEAAEQQLLELKEQQKRRAQYTLPDGQTIQVEDEGRALGEALLLPSILGADLPPLAESIYTAGLVTTLHGEKSGDARKILSDNILLCGGGSLVPGLCERILPHLTALSHPSLPPSLCTIPEYMPLRARQRAAWLGGALLAKVAFAPAAPHQAQQQMTKGDYEEYGPQGAHRKFAA